MTLFQVINSLGSDYYFADDIGAYYFTVEHLDAHEVYIKLRTKTEIKTETILEFHDLAGEIGIQFATFNHPNVNRKIRGFFAKTIANPSRESFCDAILETLKFIEEMFSVFAGNTTKSARNSAN